MFSSSQLSAIRSGSGKPLVPGFWSKTEMENEWTVLGRSAAAAGRSETFLASSAVAARVNVSSFMRGAGFWATSGSSNATSVALFPVPGPAGTRA